MTTILPALLIILYCGWNARGLITAWQGQVEIGGSIAFVLWLLPFADYWLIRRKRIQPNQTQIIIALAISLLGVLGSVNVICYAGFAIAIAAFLPFTWLGLPWLLCMITWTPVFGWYALHYFPHQEQIVRCVIALCSSLWMIYILRKKGKEA